jgi:hypothetical protein
LGVLESVVCIVTMILISCPKLPSFMLTLSNMFLLSFQVLTSGSFELRIKSFTNSLGRLSSGQCCDGSSSSSDAPCLAPCRTKFRVCLKIYQANIDTTSPCTFGDITTPVLGGNSLDVPNLNVEGFSNPIVFPFDFTWPVSALQYFILSAYTILKHTKHYTSLIL